MHKNKQFSHLQKRKIITNFVKGLVIFFMQFFCALLRNYL